jgi:hypothetical protein
MSYSATYPLSQREQYNPADNVDFTVQYSGKQIVPNSFAIAGKVVVMAGEELITLEDDIRYDSSCGAHGLFQHITTSFNDSIIENFQHYPRYVKMKHTASDSNIGIMATSMKAAELKFFDGFTSDEDSSTTNRILALPSEANGRSFCVKPMVCINNTTGPLRSSQTGEIKVTLQLSTVKQWLFGEDMANDVTFYLTDLELLYRTQPEQPSSEKMAMTVFTALKQIVSSNNQVLNVLAPIPTTSLATSFISLPNESLLTQNYLSLNNLPEFSRAEFVINDQIQGLLEYPLEHVEEILLNYVMAVNGAMPKGRQSYLPDYIRTNRDNVVGVGLWYETVLANTKMSVNLQSSASNADQYAAYMYFKGIVSF